MKSVNTEKIKKLLNSNNNIIFLWGKFKGFPKDPIYMSDEELYHIAMAVFEMNSKNLQRSIFQMLHNSCDHDSISRFYQYFQEEEISNIMYTC